MQNVIINKPRLSITEQLHQEMQLDTLREYHMKLLRQLDATSAKQQAQSNLLADKNMAIGDLNSSINDLQACVDRYLHLIAQMEHVVRYDNEYLNRQNYYKQFIKHLGAKSCLAYDKTVAYSQQMKVMVSPDGIPFQHERIRLIMRDAAKEGYLCFIFDSKIKHPVECVEKGVYLYQDECTLLKWLLNKSITPTVLCTWVLQNAWYDLLPSKTVWYDVCDDEDILWGSGDPNFRLAHFRLLREARKVTYSSKKSEKFVKLRKDAIYIPLNEEEHSVALLKLGEAKETQSIQ